MLNVALIGFGRMGKMHEQVLSGLDCFKVKAIVDDSLPHDLPSEVKGFKGKAIDDVLSDPNIDAVIIASSTSAHLSCIYRAIEHQKPIFCEKPVRLSVTDLNTLKEALDKSALPFQVGLNRRFDPSILQLKARLDQGTIGQPYVLKITNRDPQRPDMNFIQKSGNLFYDFTIHDFDMVHFLTGDTVQEVDVMGEALIEPKLKDYQDIDTAIITLKLSSHALAVIDCSRETSHGYDQRMEVLGENGLLKVENELETTLKGFYANQSTLANPKWSFVQRYALSYKNQFLQFYQLVKNGSQGSQPGINDIIKAVDVANQVNECHRKCS